MHLDRDAVHLGHCGRGAADREQRHQTKGGDQRPDRVLAAHAATFRRRMKVTPTLRGIATSNTTWSGRRGTPQAQNNPELKRSPTASIRLNNGGIIPKTTPSN